MPEDSSDRKPVAGLIYRKSTRSSSLEELQSVIDALRLPNETEVSVDKPGDQPALLTVVLPANKRHATKPYTIVMSPEVDVWLPRKRRRGK